MTMNTLERIGYLKQSIDEARSEGLNNIANLHCDDLDNLLRRLNEEIGA